MQKTNKQKPPQKVKEMYRFCYFSFHAVKNMLNIDKKQLPVGNYMGLMYLQIIDFAKKKKEESQYLKFVDYLAFQQHSLITVYRIEAMANLTNNP